MLLWRVRPHDPQIMLGMLAEVLHFDGVAFQGSFTGSCQVALIICMCDAQGHCAAGTLDKSRRGKEAAFCRSSALSLCCGSCVHRSTRYLARRVAATRRCARRLSDAGVPACTRPSRPRRRLSELFSYCPPRLQSHAAPTLLTECDGNQFNADSIECADQPHKRINSSPYDTVASLHPLDGWQMIVLTALPARVDRCPVSARAVRS
jgi:hypothetical protein